MLFVLYLIIHCLMLMLGLKETRDLPAKASTKCLYGHLLKREGGHVLRIALYLEVKVQRMKSVL